ncbi:16711_t:CDS:1 [Racocetra fulgida]|uniref:16711_t:CDS:1 n=1 Tax=Racocetra fulgida TaxID=60492 RepID=A0A9N9ITI3_9GLOM|nr:16711_t:CDS:1 [Racocetra fulgida]
MNPPQTSNSVEESNISLLRNDMQIYESEQFEKEPFLISLPYEPEAKVDEIFDIDSSEEENEESALKIYKNQTFQTWDDAETFLKKYTLEQGFSIRKRRTETCIEDGIEVMHKISWKCSCASKYKPKKVLNLEDQQNRRSKYTGCEWKINGNMLKSSLVVTFTTVENSHNHPMSSAPSTTIAYNRKLGEDMIEFVDFCVTHSITRAQNIGQLLRGKFPSRKIYKKNLYNAIQNAKIKLSFKNELDASNLLQHMYSLKTNDPR